MTRALFLSLLCCLPLYAEDYWDYLGVFTITRYNESAACCWPFDDGYTATGTKVRYGVVAVDPKVISLGSEIKIEGFQKFGFPLHRLTTFMAEDVGGKIKGYKIDVYHYDYEYCLQWGKQRRRVWIGKSGDAVSQVIDKSLDALHVTAEIVIAVPCWLGEMLFG